jgi:nitric oxide reductase NorE protein
MTTSSRPPEVLGHASLRRDGSLRDEARRVPGEPGVWVFLAGDLVIFTVLFGVYLHRRALDRNMFAESQQHLNRTLGATNTIILLTSSVLVALAAKSIRDRYLRRFTPWLTLAGAAVGSCFVIIKAVEYHQKLSAGITPATNDFYMYYYVLTGLHLAHVVIGLIVLSVLSRLAAKPAPTPTHIIFFEGGACFWHLVDLLWIVIFPLLFLVR